MTNNSKIYDLHELGDKLKERGNKRVVMCHGVFDLLHIGHIRHFERAREHGDILVATLTPDHFVDKGPGRPAFPEALRAEGLASLQVIDYVAVNKWKTAEETLRVLRPDAYAKGSEFKDIDSCRVGKIGPEAAVVEEIGAKMVFTEDVVFSSSNLINRFLSELPKEQQEYMRVFRQRHSLDDVCSVLDGMAGLKVLVLGDAIIDEYVYGEAIGKSSKDPVLALKYCSMDRFAGGVVAVANHVAGFVGSVDLACVVGELDNHEAFIRNSLQPNVCPSFYVQKNAPTIVKRRFIDNGSLNKLLEIYDMDDAGLCREEEMRLIKELDAAMDSYDAVIVADYGHGAVSKPLVDLLVGRAPFLAVNTQANAGNRGFHTIAKYRRADFISLAEHEMRLEYRMDRPPERSEIVALAERAQASALAVTHGRCGCSVWGHPDHFCRVPAFGGNVVDVVGAGDAFLSVTALAAKLGTHAEIIGLLGNIAGSLAVGVLGNEKSLHRKQLEKYATALIK